MNNSCTRGEGCQFAHSPEDLRVAPDLTRTKMCAELIRKGRCGVPNCRFAHSRSQVRFVSMTDLAGDDGNVLQSEHPPDMRHWDQLPAVNMPHSKVPPQSGTNVHQMVSVHGSVPPETSHFPCKDVSVVSSGEEVFWKQTSGGRCSSQEESADVQGGFLPGQSSQHFSADPFMALNSWQCAALLPFGSCRSASASSNQQAQLARGPRPESSYFQPLAAPRFPTGQSPLAGDGFPWIPALDHVNGDKTLWVQQDVHACAQAPQGPDSANVQDHDACQGATQSIVLTRLSV